MDSTGHLLHQATLPRHGVIAALPNTQKQALGSGEGCQNEETRKHDPNERTDQNSRKRTKKKIEISNLTDTEFKTLVIRMLKELSEDLNSIKKIQSDTKDTLIEIKNNLQGNNSRTDEAESQINDLEHKEPKNNQSKQ